MVENDTARRRKGWKRRRRSEPRSPWDNFRSWSRSGSNAVTVLLIVVGVVWFGFQFTPHKPPILDQALMTMLGVWVTNRSVEQKRKDEARDRREAMRDIREDEREARVEQLEDFAAQAHPDRQDELPRHGEPGHEHTSECDAYDDDDDDYEDEYEDDEDEADGRPFRRRRGRGRRRK